VGNSRRRSSEIVPSIREPAVLFPVVVVVVVDGKTCRIGQTNCLTLLHVSYAEHRLRAECVRIVQRAPTTYGNSTLKNTANQSAMHSTFAL